MITGCCIGVNDSATPACQTTKVANAAIHGCFPSNATIIYAEVATDCWEPYVQHRNLLRTSLTVRAQDANDDHGKSRRHPGPWSCESLLNQPRVNCLNGGFVSTLAFTHERGHELVEVAFRRCVHVGLVLVSAADLLSFRAAYRFPILQRRVFAAAKRHAD